jgi:hypothetical protein
MKAQVFLPLLLFAAAQSLAADVCGSPGEKPSTKSVEVHLRDAPKEPAFYYRTDSYHVAFVTPEAMAAYLDQQSVSDSASAAATLIKAIRADIPLQENRDLFRYNLSNWSYLSLIESLLIGLAEHGDMSLVHPGGYAVEKITIVYERKPDITLTRLRRQEGH